MDSPSNRLKKAREVAGFESAPAAARALGVNVTTYAHHENGTRGFKKDSAQQYARRFKVSAEWLLFGRGTGPGDVPEPSEADLEAMLADVVREIPASASIGDWPRLAAPILRAQLEQFRSDRAGSDTSAAGVARDTGAPARRATTPDAGA